MASSLDLDLYQVLVDSFEWQEGPRLTMYVKIFPQYNNNGSTNTFNTSELHWIIDMIATFSIPPNDTYGAYDLLNFALLGPYSSIPRIPVKIEGVKELSFVELEIATNSFSINILVGRGSYGKVYKDVLADGTIVAIKRAKQGSFQGQNEFYTEIELLSRLHDRNLVSLVGYCDEEDEQMLEYEFMPNGSLHNLLAARLKRPVNFAMRLYIALGSAKGILYLHTEADPPIIHRDIKANNILLDSKLTAKVSDFGISKLAPVTDGEEFATHISTVVKGTPVHAACQLEC